MGLVRNLGGISLCVLAVLVCADQVGSLGLFGQKMVTPSEAPAVVTAARATTGPRMVTLQADSRGHFMTDIRANNQFVRALVDTGASVVALTAEDARKIGVQERSGGEKMLVSTANGMLRVPKVKIPELSLQSLVVRDVEAAIMPAGAMSNSLLGMSFLKRLGSFEMQGKTLMLRQ